MQMTNEECQDYNKLTKEQKEDFEYHSRKHPDWNFKQVMAKMVFDGIVDETIGKGGEDPNPKDPTIWLTILEGVRTTLTKFKSIGRSIFIAIDSAITSLKGLIRAGIQRIGDVIDNLLDKIF